jgi:hypothetical protein
MAQPIPVEELSREVTALYRAEPGRAEVLVERYLAERLGRLPPEEKIAFLENFSRQYARTQSPSQVPDGSPSEEFTQLISLLLGHRVSSLDFSLPEFREKFAASLNTIFDSLNQIIAVIQATLLGRKVELETIRQVIGSSLGKEGRADSLQSYLDQIREAFWVAHRAFQEAALAKMRTALGELDPERLEAEGEGGLKFGPFLKADLFDQYKERFQKCKSWMDSDRFRDELLREFEKICEKLYKVKTGGFP